MDFNAASTDTPQALPPQTGHKAWAGAAAGIIAIGAAQLGLTGADASTITDLILSSLGSGLPPAPEKIQALVASVLTMLVGGLATWAGVFYKKNYLKKS
jgi:hypothetical protein